MAAALLLLASPLSTHAAQSIWANQSTAAARLVTDYRSEHCPKKPPAAYTGHLQLDSKYDQNDASKVEAIAARAHLREATPVLLASSLSSADWLAQASSH